MSESNGTDRKELHQMEYLNSSHEKDRLFFGEKLSILVGPATCKDIVCFV